MKVMKRIVLAGLACVAALLAWPSAPHAHGIQPPQGPEPFRDWAVAVVAADWRDSAGQPIAAFDNARRDLVQAFAAAGFDRADMVDYSLRPDVTRPIKGAMAVEGVSALAARATRGCLIYFTSHGSPDGMVFGPETVLDPPMMTRLIRGWCDARPTVVVISACYSGIFMDALQAPNRMIITAARRDRSSFGCGADSLHPYFDGCMIQSLPTARDFIALAHAARACVDRREAEEGLTPPSEPQVFIGATLQMLLPTLRFRAPPP